MAFIEVLQQQYRVLYFETREKEGTQFQTDNPDFSITAMAEDLVHFINLIKTPYSLVGVSVGTSVIMQAWPGLNTKPTSLALLCPVLKVRMPIYFRIFPFIDIEVFTRIAPLVYRLLCISPRLKSVRTTLYQAMTEQDFTEIAVMKASVQQLLQMPCPLQRFNCTMGGNTLVVRSMVDPIHTATDADQVVNGIGVQETFSCPDFRAVHGAETAARLLPFLRRKNVYALHKQAG